MIIISKNSTIYLVQDEKDARNLQIEDIRDIALVTQTTLSVDDTREVILALRKRFPDIVGPDLRDICYATQNRQSAVRELAKLVDVMLVIGAINSSNSNRLRDIGAEMSVPSYLIEDAGSINLAWLEDVETVGITAGASAPEDLVQEVVSYLRNLTEVKLETLPGIVENVEFKLPSELEKS